MIYEFPYKQLAIFLGSFFLLAFGSLLAVSINSINYSKLGEASVLSSVSEFQQTINPGTLSVDIVNGSLNAVASPAVSLNAVDFSFACQTTTGTFGTATEQIYVSNPDAADNGWNVTLAASNVSDVWTGVEGSYDFNDAGGAGCTDSDTDTYAGQLSVDPSVGTLALGNCSSTTSCSTANISKGSSSAFDNGTVDTITLLSAANTSDDRGDWTFQGISISQTIPASQPAASDYTLDMTLTVTAI